MKNTGMIFHRYFEKSNLKKIFSLLFLALFVIISCGKKSEEKEYEVILTMPSSHKIVERFAKKIARRTSNECILLNNIFTKK